MPADFDFGDLFPGAPPELVAAIIDAIKGGTGLEREQLDVIENWYIAQDANQKAQISVEWSKFEEQARQFDSLQKQEKYEFSQKFGLDMDRFEETQRQFDSQLDQQAYQFASQFGLDTAKFQETAYQFDVMDERQKQQFAAQLGLNYDQLNTTIQQFNVTEDRLRDQFAQTIGLDRNKFEEASRQFNVTNERLKETTEKEFGFKYEELGERERASRESERTRRAEMVLNAPRGPADFFAYTARLKGLQESGELGDFLTGEIERSTGTTREQLAQTPVLTETQYAQGMNKLAQGQPANAETQGFLSRIGAAPVSKPQFTANQLHYNATTLPRPAGVTPSPTSMTAALRPDVGTKPITPIGAPLPTTVDEPDPDKPLPTYDRGSLDVPRTGKARIHRGEMILPEYLADVIRQTLTEYVPTKTGPEMPPPYDIRPRGTISEVQPPDRLERSPRNNIDPQPHTSYVPRTGPQPAPMRRRAPTPVQPPTVISPPVVPPVPEPPVPVIPEPPVPVIPEPPVPVPGDSDNPPPPPPPPGGGTPINPPEIPDFAPPYDFEAPDEPPVETTVPAPQIEGLWPELEEIIIGQPDYGTIPETEPGEDVIPVPEPGWEPGTHQPRPEPGWEGPDVRPSPEPGWGGGDFRPAPEPGGLEPDPGFLGRVGRAPLGGGIGPGFQFQLPSGDPFNIGNPPLSEEPPPFDEFGNFEPLPAPRGTSPNQQVPITEENEEGNITLPTPWLPGGRENERDPLYNPNPFDPTGKGFMPMPTYEDFPETVKGPMQPYEPYEEEPAYEEEPDDSDDGGNEEDEASGDDDGGGDDDGDDDGGGDDDGDDDGGGDDDDGWAVGTLSVPQTGTDTVHQGEMILPVDQAQQVRAQAGIPEQPAGKGFIDELGNMLTSGRFKRYLGPRANTMGTSFPMTAQPLAAPPTGFGSSVQDFRRFEPTTRSMFFSALGERGGQLEGDFLHGLRRAAPNYMRSQRARLG